MSETQEEQGVSSRQAHAVVIGSGLGGLAAAIRLGARGFRVTIVDRLDAPGGRAYVHHRDGFSFDAGPTIITAPFILEELWSLCGRNFADDVELREMTPFYRVRFDDGDYIDYGRDVDAVSAQIARISPEDVEGYKRFIKQSGEIYKVGFEGLVDEPFTSWTAMAKVAPDMVRLKSYRSVYAMVAHYVKHPKIRRLLSFHPLLVGGDPFRVTSIYTLISYLEREWGVYSAMGGTGALVRGMVKLIEGQGGLLRHKAEVEEILVKHNRTAGVRLLGGEEIEADIVVSDVDPATTYMKLLPGVQRKRWTDRKLQKAKYSNGLFVWYFGTDRQYPDVKHHSILLGERYQGLIKDIFSQKLSEDFSLYLYRPTATDPSLAPAGCDTFYALSPVPHLGSHTDWSAIAESYRQRVEQYLSETVLPDLGQHIVTSLVTTPLDFRERLSSYLGAGFSLEPTFTQSAWFRPHNVSEELDGLYLVGAGTHPGAGVPGVISSAKILDKVVPDAATFL